MSRGSQVYSCPEKHAEHKTVILKLLKEAETALGLVGPPQYDFQDAEACICFRGSDKVAFEFNVAIVGGGRCKVENEALCQGAANPLARGQVEGDIMDPSGDVIFRL